MNAQYRRPRVRQCSATASGTLLALDFARNVKKRRTRTPRKSAYRIKNEAEMSRAVGSRPAPIGTLPVCPFLLQIQLCATVLGAGSWFGAYVQFCPSSQSLCLPRQLVFPP
jgi:hypothetical protein